MMKERVIRKLINITALVLAVYVPALMWKLSEKTGSRKSPQRPWRGVS